MAPIKVVTAENGKLFLNEEVLKNLMLRQDLLNLNVIVISVAGRVYQDKSFILNFLVRYLKHKHDNKTEDWLEKDDRLEGFWYENSVEKITNGIFIWDEIFKVRTESNEEVAIILMDTQGLFSLESTIQDAMNIIAFSLFSASVQIYNLTQNVCGDDLSYLHLFTAYSESMGDEVGLQNGPKFQDLVLFFREWQHSPKCPFGVHGGDTYLEM
ncbi:atlastin-3-like [Tropilaelaps mercedesae]|uniref:Atlastin-3-like n=1 Tax=Tropilaelaps mercedesae TaxID=418985 RepID=A0A1V9XV72_9ACAR|nr:atlastin-3-like [Tropilaelaps mercedesae]